VPRRTLAGVADLDVVDVTAVVDQVAVSAVGAADELLRLGIEPTPPTVHMLCGGLAQPYVGHVVCRPFAAGRDAAAAVQLLGLLPSVLAATHLVIVWEYAALRDALEPDGGPAPTGLVVLEASLASHVVRWYPNERRVGGVAWGEPARFADAELPVPVEYLLRSWRRLVPDDVAATADTLERAGYRVRWAARS
jgi:hypothetical protein